jgi:hypothetical protein
VQLGAPAAAA